VKGQSTTECPGLSVVVPVYNEAQCLPILRERLGKVIEELDVESEVMLVDDGSTDISRKLITEIAKEDGRWRGIFLARNFGHQAAITAGLDHARGDFVVVMDCDLQDKPEDIPKLLEKAREGFDIVYARRAGRKGNPFKRLCYWLFYRMLAGVADTSIPVDAGDFTCMSRKAADAIRALPERNRFVRGLRAWVGFRHIGIDVQRDRRAAGKRKYTLGKLMRLAADAIFSFSWVPLRLVSVVGVLSVLVSLVYLAVIIILRLSGEIPRSGWTTIIFLIIAFGGLILTALGIIGEYIGRIYDEVKKRPIYIVAETTDAQE
jgi:glycosyltransferase involved in cell wall biosynthesis